MSALKLEIYENTDLVSLYEWTGSFSIASERIFTCNSLSTCFLFRNHKDTDRLQFPNEPTVYKGEFVLQTDKPYDTFLQMCGWFKVSKFVSVCGSDVSKLELHLGYAQASWNL